MFKSGDVVRIESGSLKGEKFIFRSIINDGLFKGFCICEYIGDKINDEEFVEEYLHNCKGFFIKEIGRFFQYQMLRLDIVELRKRKLKCLKKEIQ